MPELNPEIGSKLASCTIRPGAQEDEILRACQELGLSVDPVRHYYKAIAFSSNDVNQTEVNMNIPLEDETVTNNGIKKVINQSEVTQSVATEAVTSGVDVNVANVPSCSGMVTHLIDFSKTQKNPIAELKEICDRNNCLQHVYNIVKTSSDTVRPQWQCTVLINDFGPKKRSVAVTETAFSKQQAKTKASQTLLEKLKNIEQRNSKPIFSEQVDATNLLAINFKNVLQINGLADSINLKTVPQSVVVTENVATFSKKISTSDDLCDQKVKKTPTQLLYEYCQKVYKNSPIFGESLINPETGEFVTTVTVGTCIGTGTGKKKKDSKEKAAVDVMNKLKSEAPFS